MHIVLCFPMGISFLSLPKGKKILSQLQPSLQSCKKKQLVKTVRSRMRTELSPSILGLGCVSPVYSTCKWSKLLPSPATQCWPDANRAAWGG